MPGGSFFQTPSITFLRVPGTLSADLKITGHGTDISKLLAGDITGGKWTMAGGVSSINVHSVTDGRFALAGAIDLFNVQQDFTNTTLSLPSIGTFKVGGDVVNSVFSFFRMPDLLTYNVKRATIGGQVKDSTVFCEGNVNYFGADALNHTEIYCGVKQDVSELLPSDPANAFGQEVLFNVLKLRGKKQAAMAQSVLVAAHFGNLDLGTVQIPGSGLAQGISTKSIVRLVMLLNGKKLTLKNLLKIPDLARELEDAGLTLNSLQDFQINLPAE
jgi:hypothetical protein